MAKSRVVFDTNVFVRALINPRGINARLLESRQRFVLITSPAIIEEVTEVLARIDLLRAKAIREVVRRSFMVSSQGPKIPHVPRPFRLEIERTIKVGLRKKPISVLDHYMSSDMLRSELRPHS